MDPEGMVHALENVHRLLTPDGTLIDIHPLPELPSVDAYQEGSITYSEQLLVRYLDGIARAERALALVVEVGLFAAGKKIVIDFRHHAASPQELFAHWDAIEPYSDEPKDPGVAASEKEIFARLGSVFQATGTRSKVSIRERASVSHYLPVRK